MVQASIAIIGAGLSGLATAWHLLQKEMFRVTLFDQVGIGGGASGVATGLMHPYPGEQGRRSLFADESMAASVELFEIAAQMSGKPVIRTRGILRHLPILNPGVDVEGFSDGTSLIKSGLTVDMGLYLQGLWLACKAKGAVLYPVKISHLEKLQDYDHIIVAAGAGIVHFSECQHLKVKLIKGQVLTGLWPSSMPPLLMSQIAKGYIASGEDSQICQVGATYERSFSTDAADLDAARHLLLPKMLSYFPFLEDMKFQACRAGVRVIRQGHYLPIVEKLSDKVWVMTALGSRGLLYHSLYAKQLSDNLAGIYDSAICVD